MRDGTVERQVFHQEQVLVEDSTLARLTYFWFWFSLLSSSSAVNCYASLLHYTGKASGYFFDLVIIVDQHKVFKQSSEPKVGGGSSKHLFELLGLF